MSLPLVGWTAMTYLAFVTAVSSLQFITFDTNVFDPLFRAKYAKHLPLVLTHGVFAIAALLTGPWQFIPAVRHRWPGLHRWMGRLYMAAILVGGITGFRMALMAYGGPPAQVGLMGLAVVWLISGALSLTTILRGDIQGHRRWMARNYALTFSASLLRVYILVGSLLDVEYAVLYPICAWAAWVPTLIVVWWKTA